MNRLLLYVHFNKYDALSGHVLYQLEHMKPLFSQVVVISNSSLSQDDEQKIHELGISEIIQRENKGYDFAAWRDGMNHIGFENLVQYDSVTLMNDTCFGPLWDVEPIFTQFEERTDIDFWGMTNFRQTKYFKEHLQSYFLSFSKEVVASQPFRKFWSAIENFENVQDVIDNYETQVTTNLIEAGYRYDAVFNTLSEDARDLVHPDFSYYRPLQILEHRVPLLKVKAVQADERKSLIIADLITTTSVFPIEIMKQNLHQFSSPDSLLLLPDKMISEGLDEDSISEQQKLIHVYVDNIEAIKLLLRKNIRSTYYIFTASEGVDVENLEKIVSNHLSEDSFSLRTDTRYKNHFQALFSISEEFEDYDLIGNFHTSLLTIESNEVDYLMRKWFSSLLLDNIYGIERLFKENPSIGLVFSDLSKESYLLQKRDYLIDNKENSSRAMLQVFGGFYFISSQCIKEMLEEEPLLKMTKEYQDEDMRKLLYNLCWSNGWDYRIISEKDNQYSYLLKNELLTIPRSSESNVSKVQYIQTILHAIYKKIKSRKVFNW